MRTHGRIEVRTSPSQLLGNRYRALRRIAISQNQRRIEPGQLMFREFQQRIFDPLHTLPDVTRQVMCPRKPRMQSRRIRVYANGVFENCNRFAESMPAQREQEPDECGPSVMRYVARALECLQ